MAYFANGTEGHFYEAEYCERCVHYGESGDACPILALHADWNYEACNGNEPDATPEARAKHIALNMLWPCDGIRNGPCAMFYAEVTCNAKPTGSTCIALGWANGWSKDPQIVQDCKAKKHPRRERNLDPTMHGYDHLVWCDICGYEYHYDSSG